MTNQVEGGRTSTSTSASASILEVLFFGGGGGWTSASASKGKAGAGGDPPYSPSGGFVYQPSIANQATSLALQRSCKT